MTITGEIERDNRVVFFAVKFPDRQINRMTADNLGYELLFDACDQEIVDWCTLVMGPPHDGTWRYQGDSFYFAREQSRTACILAWE